MAPSRYDWKIVDWDVKPQHNQPSAQHNWYHKIFKYVIQKQVQVISVDLEN